MSSEKSQIERLLDRWEDEQSAGRQPDITQLCADCPEMIPVLRERVAAIQKMEMLLKSESTPTLLSGSGKDRMKAPHHSPAAGTFLEAVVQYRVVASHARGGLGEVLIAQDERLLRRVAVKRILEPGSPDPLRRRRFLREAEITGRLDHPGIVSILSVGKDQEGAPIYAMKFISGETLGDKSRRLHEQFAAGGGDRRLFETQVIRPLLSRLIAVCNTIAYAHSQNVIHRDIKPANIMLGEFGATYVVDWGLARCSEGTGNSEAEVRNVIHHASSSPVYDETIVPYGSQTETDVLPDADLLTRTGSVLGTPAYMSPEQASGQNEMVGTASDVYSLGATLYFLLTGRTPVTSLTDAAWIEQLRSAQFPRPREIQKFVPQSLEAVCCKAMALHPRDRYASPLELASELERWMTDEPVMAMADSFSERLARFMRRHRAWTQSVATAVLIVAATAVVFAFLLNTQKNIANQRSLEASAAELKARELAGQKTLIAESEAVARKTADEQGRLALATLRSVVLDISRKLQTVPGASEVRQGLLKTAIDGLNKVAVSLDNRSDADRNLAIAHNDIGRIYLIAGDIEGTDSTGKALKHYLQAMEISQRLAAADSANPELQRDLSVSYEKIGDLRKQLGNLELAEDSYAKSLQVSEEQLATRPNDPDLRRDVAFGYEKLGDVQIAREQVALAGDSYRRSFELYRQNAEALPANTTVQRDLLVGQSKLGNLYVKEGDLERAAEVFRQCIRTCEALEKIPESGAQMRDRSISHNKLGQVLQQQTLLEDALNEFRLGLAIAIQCLETAPNDLTARRDASVSLNNVGDVLTLQGKFEESRQLFTESLEIRRRILDSDASSQVAKVDVAQCLLRLGQLEMMDMQSQKASELLTEAMAILHPLKDAGLLQSTADQQLFDSVQAKLDEIASQQ